MLGVVFAAADSEIGWRPSEGYNFKPYFGRLREIGERLSDTLSLSVSATPARNLVCGAKLKMVLHGGS